MVVTTSFMVLFLLFEFCGVDKLFFSFLIYWGRTSFSNGMGDFWLFVRSIFIMIVVLFPKVILSHHEVILLLILYCSCQIEKLFVFVFSFSCNLLVEKRLIKGLSIIGLCSVKCVSYGRLLLIDKVDFVCSLRSSHWRIGFDVSLFQSTCCLNRRIWGWDSKITIKFSFLKTSSCSVLCLFALVRVILIFRKSFFSRSYVVGRILLLKLLLGLIVILVACILTDLLLNLKSSFRARRRSHTIRRLISSRNQNFWRIAFLGLVSDLWHSWPFFSI